MYDPFRFPHFRWRFFPFSRGFVHQEWDTDHAFHRGAAKREAILLARVGDHDARRASTVRRRPSANETVGS